MFNEEFTEPPRDEAHFWEMVEYNFDVALEILSMRLQTREQAIGGEVNIAALSAFIPYRGATTENDQREYFYNLGNAQLERLEQLIHQRQLSIEFVQAWGVLMCAFGHTVNYVMDDSKVLAAERAAAASAEKRSPQRQQKWLAHIVYPRVRKGDKRSDIDQDVTVIINDIIAKKGLAGFPKVWFEKMVEKEPDEEGIRALKPIFSEKHFGVPKMLGLLELPVDDIPPFEQFVPS